MPLTAFQQQLLADVAASATDDRYLAGGAALHFEPHTTRFSNDLDFFHDSVDRVARAFSADAERLRALGYTVTLEISQPGFIRARVTRDGNATRVDWAHDSAWRFMPLVPSPLGGLLLHPVDLAINKALALAGRDEPRDFYDILVIHRTVLPLGAVVWAAAGKDPGFTPLSLLELLKRRGRYQPGDFARLQLTEPFDLVIAKQTWLRALADAERFARSSPAEEVGCLYWSQSDRAFVMPDTSVPRPPHVVPHFGRPAGVLPQVAE